MAFINVLVTYEELQMLIDGMEILQPDSDEACDLQKNLLSKLYYLNQKTCKPEAIFQIPHDGSGAPV